MKNYYSLRLNVYLFISVLGIVLSFSTNGYSLGWSDKEWIASGCPTNILGTWIPRSSPDKTLHQMKILKGTVLLTSQSGTVQKLFYSESKFIKNTRFLQFDLKEDSSSSQNLEIWKVRPHLAWKANDQEATAGKKSDCLIKVLRFKSEKQARFDKYQSWDIYQKASN